MSNEHWPIQVLLVPAGAEYQAVQQGLKKVPDAPDLVAIPAGPQALQAFLEKWEDRQHRISGGVLLLGLGGSLTSKYDLGATVILTTVWNDFHDNETEPHTCDRPLIDWLAQRLPEAALGTGVTCDHVVTTAVEKQLLRDRYQADVVDMESSVFLTQNPGGKLAVLRVISDDCEHDLPDISTAIGSDGSIQPLPLALKFVQRPLAAARLIRGSLRGLKTLEKMTMQLFQFR